MGTNADADAAARLERAEALLETSPAPAIEELEALSADSSASIRVQALALRAIYAAGRGSDDGFRIAEELLAEAAAVRTRSRLARARVAHGRGYLAFRRSERSIIFPELNRAASLYDADDPRRAQLFDILGRHLWYDVGDPARSRAFFELSLSLKKRAADQRGDGSQQRGIAITYGNLGRLALAQEEFTDAERWFREDLEVIQAGGGRPGDEAHVRNQLALALIGRGFEHLEDAQHELERALEVAPDGSQARAYILKDLGRVAVERGDLKRAADYFKEARDLASAGGYREVGIATLLERGRMWAARARSADDTACIEALADLAAAFDGYEKMSMHLEVCYAAEARADLLAKVGRADEAVTMLTDIAIPIAERHLFRQRQPLTRLAAKLEAHSPIEILRLRTRRMLGGLMPEQHQGRLRCERERITVWTCDIRGFSSYCEETDDPMLVVDMLNRFFDALGRPILDAGGRIDKYVGDNILAYFRDAEPAAMVALEALEIVEQLNEERTHLSERVLGIGIGLATGEVVTGNVGFAGKLEHTIVGSAVNRACRLVNEALPGAVLIDRPTREAIGSRFITSPVRGRTMALKGLGKVEVFELRGRARRR